MSMDIPTPSAEREPRFPTLEEIQSQMQRLMNRSDYKKEREVPDESGIKLYEVTIVGEDGITAVYTYRKADGVKIMTTSIDVSYCNGSPDDNDWLGGGCTVLNYDPNHHEWSDANVEKSPTVTEDISVGLASLQEIQAEQKEVPLAKADETEITKEKFGTLLDEANLQVVFSLFDLARTEGAQCQRTLEIIYPKLLNLNLSDRSTFRKYQLDMWDPQGKLTEARFTALTIQFRELSRIAGVDITKASIERDLTVIHEEIPISERIQNVLELFDVAEASLETTEIAVLEIKEGTDLGSALTDRAIAKSFADKIATELIKLNRSMGPPASLKTWNPNGDLEEGQFHELNRRRKILENAIGTTRAQKIHHDVHEI